MIGIFGGSFDPVHAGHIILAEDLIEKGIFKRIIFVPAHISPLKNHSPEATFDDRIKMIKLAIKVYPQMEVSDIERNTNISYTIDTVKRMSQQIKDIGIIIGTDQAYQFQEWKSPDEILKLVPVYVLGRKTDKNIEHKFPRRFNFLDTRIIEISSTEIRKRIKKGKSIHFFVPEEVEKYIRKNSLYK